MSPELQSRWLYHFTAPFGPPRVIGRTPHGLRLSTGLIVAAPDVFQQWQQGQPVDPSRDAMRSVYSFETSAEEYAWRQRILAVEVYTRTPTGIEGDTYQVL